jgi:hypothetical protein
LCEGDTEEENELFLENEQLHAQVAKQDDLSVPDEPGYRLLDFGSSNFKREYSWISGSETKLEPYHRGRLYDAVWRLIERFCKDNEIEVALGIGFIEELCKEWKMVDSVAVAAERLWTSARPFPQAGGREFCSIYNQVLREDRASSARNSAIIARAMNFNLTVGRSNPDTIDFPPDATCWRGGGFHDTPANRNFFEDRAAAVDPTEKKYRTNCFLPTSFVREKALEFVQRAAEGMILIPGGVPNALVMWEVTIDPQGQTIGTQKCKQANLIKNRTASVGQEWEYLFTCFSVFSVIKAEWSADATDALRPHKIHIHAAMDNSLEPEDLPLAPWS